MSTNPDERDPEIAAMTERLLGSWRGDTAPSGSKRATMVALGVGLAATTAATTVSAFGGVARVGVLGVAKALAGGALAGAVVIGTSTYIQHARAPEPVLAPSMPATGTAKTSPRHDPPPAVSAPEVEMDQSPDGPAPPTSAAPVRPRDEGSSGAGERLPLPAEATTLQAPSTPPLGASPGTAPERVSSLAREIALLDESRASLARGDAIGALKLLDRHVSEFAHGNLGPEAVVIRIEALLRLGDERSARALASQFANDHPNDSHLARIKSLLNNIKTPTGDRP